MRAAAEIFAHSQSPLVRQIIEDAQMISLFERIAVALFRRLTHPQFNFLPMTARRKLSTRLYPKAARR